MIKILLLVAFLCAIANPCRAWPARVVSVVDGDTIVVEPVDGGEQVKIRLHGVDAPERRQPSGEAARSLMFAVALFRHVLVEGKGQDRYGRVVAIVRLNTGESLQSVLLKSGLAWVWPRYCRDCQAWEELQKNAQQFGMGVWSETSTIPPWEWRRGVLPDFP